MPLLRVSGLSETQSLVARTPSTQRFTREGGFRIGMTPPVRIQSINCFKERKSLDLILNSKISSSRIQEDSEQLTNESSKSGYSLQHKLRNLFTQSSQFQVLQVFYIITR